MNIVVAFNDSEDARAAVAWGAEIASRAGAEVHVVHAVASPAVPAGANVAEVDALMRTVTAAATKRVDAVLTDLRARKIAAHGHVGRWIAVDAIIDVADKTHAGLIVVGRRGSSRATQLLLGTNSSEIVRLAKTPVMVVPRGSAPGRVARVLVGVDGSAPSVQAIRIASAAFAGATLVVAHVENALTGAVDVGRAVGDARLDAKVKVEKKTLKGDAAAELLAEVGRGGYEAVAVGARGMGMLKGLLLGSVSDKVVQLASVPVLIAR